MADGDADAELGALVGLADGATGEGVATMTASVTLAEGLGDGDRLGAGVALAVGGAATGAGAGAEPEPDVALEESWVAMGFGGAVACADAVEAGSVTVTPRLAVARSVPFDAVIVNAWETVAVGVPDNSPVEASKVSPAGAAGDSA